MTEIAGATKLGPTVRQFVLQWGDLGDRWGVNRSVSQIHALLYASETPMTAEDIAAALNIARSNVSTSLKELQSWNIIQTVPVLGDRRTFYAAETDLWEVVARIVAGRKVRELDPAAAALRRCIDTAQNDSEISPVVRDRFGSMLEFVERTGQWYEQLSRLPRAQITTLMKLGGGVARFLDRRRARRRIGSSQRSHG